YKRKYFQRTGKGGPVLSFLQSHFEGAMLSKERFESIGPHVISKGASGISNLLGKVAIGAAAPLLEPATNALKDFSDQQRRVGKILSVFVPFTAEYDYIFQCDNTRAANARLNEEDRRRVGWAPETIDWRTWFMEVHVPGLEKWVFPEIEERVNRPRKAPRP